MNVVPGVGTPYLQEMPIVPGVGTPYLQEQFSLKGAVKKVGAVAKPLVKPAINTALHAEGIPITIKLQQLPIVPGVGTPYLQEMPIVPGVGTPYLMEMPMISTTLGMVPY